MNSCYTEEYNFKIIKRSIAKSYVRRKFTSNPEKAKLQDNDNSTSYLGFCQC